MNSLARSNASIYGTKEDLYDRLKRHAYPGKKGKLSLNFIIRKHTHTSLSVKGKVSYEHNKELFGPILT